MSQNPFPTASGLKVATEQGEAEVAPPRLWGSVEGQVSPLPLALQLTLLM